MKYLSISQVADLLDYSRQWVWTLIKMGKINAHKIGNQFVIDETELINSNIKNKKNGENNNEI